VTLVSKTLAEIAGEISYLVDRAKGFRKLLNGECRAVASGGNIYVEGLQAESKIRPLSRCPNESLANKGDITLF
jgi:hypothetical protein